MECSICINTIDEKDEDTVTLDCGHSFHLKCINMWLNINNSCPNCRNMVINTFKCKYSPYTFLPFIGKKDCVLKIEDDNITINFINSPHIKHTFKFEDIQKIFLVGESVVIKYKISEDLSGRRKFKNFSYDFVHLQSAINIFNSLCNKLNQEYVSYRNLILN